MENNDLNLIEKTGNIKEQDDKNVKLILKNENKNRKGKNTITGIINRGTGAGGANTNYHGKKFEDKTNNQIRLLNDGYIKNSFTKKPKKYMIIT